MKKIICVILFLCMFLCTGCTKPQIDYNYDKYDYDIFEGGFVEYYEVNDQWNVIELLKDYDSYQEYITRISEKRVHAGLYEKLSSYDKAFFEEQMLVVFVYHASSGQSKLSIMDIVYEETNIEVVVRCDYPKDGATEDEETHAILLRLPKDDTYTTIEYRVVEKYELPGEMFPN